LPSEGTGAGASTQNASASAQAAIKDSQEAYADAIAAGKSAKDAAAAQAKLQQDKDQADSSQPSTSSDRTTRTVPSVTKSVRLSASLRAGSRTRSGCCPASYARFAPAPPNCSAVGYFVVPDIAQGISALIGVAIGIAAGKEASKLLDDLLARDDVMTRHYRDMKYYTFVPSSIRVKLEWVTNSMSALVGYAYSVTTGSYNDPLQYP
jgi:hypothetical protein